MIEQIINPSSVLIATVITFLMFYILRMKTKLSEISEKETIKLREDLQRILGECLTVDVLYYPSYLTIDDRFRVKILKDQYPFLVQYIFRKGYKFELRYYKPNRKPASLKGKLLKTYNNLNDLAIGYMKFRKEMFVKEKLQEIQEDFD
jgi:hypothetical protein